MRSVFKSLARNNFFFGEKVHTFKHARRQTKNNMETRRTREKKTHSQYVVWIFRRTINAPELVPTYNRVNPATPWCRSRPISHKTKFTLIWIRKIIAKNVQFLQVDVECALYVYWVAAKIISCFIFIFLFFFSVVVVVAASDSSMAFALSSASTAINFTPLECWVAESLLRVCGWKWRDFKEPLLMQSPNLKWICFERLPARIFFDVIELMGQAICNGVRSMRPQPLSIHSIRWHAISIYPNSRCVRRIVFPLLS